MIDVKQRQDYLNDSKIRCILISITVYSLCKTGIMLYIFQQDFSSISLFGKTPLETSILALQYLMQTVAFIFTFAISMEFYIRNKNLNDSLNYFLIRQTLWKKPGETFDFSDIPTIQGTSTLRSLYFSFYNDQLMISQILLMIQLLVLIPVFYVLLLDPQVLLDEQSSDDNLFVIFFLAS